MKELRPILVGIALAAATMLVVTRLEARQGLELMAAILVAAGAVYPGAALAGERRLSIRLETAVGIGFIVTAVVGLWFSPLLVAAGFLAHGVWDFFHHPHRVGAEVGQWFPPFCLVYDEIVGVFIVMRFGLT